MTNEKSAYLAGIDGLRAVAVLSVIIFHLRSGALPGGFAGVDVFFVISGYVVTGSLSRDASRRLVGFLTAFYARRVLRIYPALIVCLLVTSLTVTLFVPSAWLSTTTNKTGLSAFFGLSNFALVLLNDGYFAPRVEFNAFTHTWSLAVEEQFYLIFPCVLFPWVATRFKNDLIRVVLKSMLPALAATSLLFCWHETISHPTEAYYLLPSRFWELASGAGLFMLHSDGKAAARNRWYANVCILSGIALVVFGLYCSDPRSFPFPWSLVTVAASLLIITGVSYAPGSRSSLASSALQSRLAVYVGKISYSLYLWHWPVIVFFRWTVGIDRPLQAIAAAVITVLLSIISYHGVERLVGRLHPLVHRSAASVVSIGVLVIVASAMAAAGIYKSQPLISLSVTKDRMAWYPEEWPGSAPSPAQAPSMAKHTLFVLGDSHVEAYGTMLEQLKEQRHPAVHRYHMAGCAIANLLRPASQECATFLAKTVAEIMREARPGDIVFLASLRMNRLGDEWMTYDESAVVKEQNSESAADLREQALKDADDLVSLFESASLKVMIDAPKPVFKSPPFRCSDWFNSKNPVCLGGPQMDRKFLLDFRSLTMASTARLAIQHPMLVVWDAFPILCPAPTCSAFDGALPLFFDGDHLSAHGNRVLYESFSKTVSSMWSAQ